MTDKDLIKIYKKYGNDIVKRITKLLLRKGKKASGNLIKSLNYDLVEVANGILIEINANDYLEYVDKGRKKGKYPPIKAIKNWCRIKGINDKYSYAIARSIYKNGIKPTNVIRDAINDLEKRGYKDIEDAYALYIENQLIIAVNEEK